MDFIIEKKKMILITSGVVVAGILAGATLSYAIGSKKNNSMDNAMAAVESMEPLGEQSNNVWSKDEFLKTDNQQSDINVTAVAVDTDKNSYTVLVNKEYPIDEDYVPSDLVMPNVDFSFSFADEKRYMRKEAAESLEKMFAAAEYYGHKLYATSGYRSYSRQTTLYNYNLLNRGYDYTNVYSARPGRSEHQTGLAMDITSKSVSKQLTDKFADTEEGKWVKDNCYKYGFILRYPKDKEAITGYAYEPWHFRYVGYDLAKYIYDNNITLDEYYGYKMDVEVVDKEQRSYYENLTGGTSKKDINSNVKEAELDDIVDESNVNHSSVAVPTVEPTQRPVSTVRPTQRPNESTPVVTERVQSTRTPIVTMKPHVKITNTPVITNTSEPTDEDEETQENVIKSGTRPSNSQAVEKRPMKESSDNLSNSSKPTSTQSTPSASAIPKPSSTSSTNQNTKITLVPTKEAN